MPHITDPTPDDAPAPHACDIATLREQFGRNGRADFGPGPGGLTRLRLSPKGAVAEILAHGAHLLQYQPAGQPPVLFLSQTSDFAAGKPVRGGVPICLPWFAGEYAKTTGRTGSADVDAPMHGFARTRAWRIVDVTTHNDQSASATFRLHNDGDGRQWFPNDFGAEFVITVGQSLEMSLRMRNTSGQAFRFTEALHTYFYVGDARRVTVHGLEDATYLDKTEGFARKSPTGRPIIFAGETDRIYVNTTATCRLEDPALRRQIVIEKEGSDTTVVWNPWQTRAKAMPDMDDDGWQNMVCIETANAADNVVTLAPGMVHELTARVRIEPM